MFHDAREVPVRCQEEGRSRPGCEVKWIGNLAQMEAELMVEGHVMKERHEMSECNVIQICYNIIIYIILHIIHIIISYSIERLSPSLSHLSRFGIDVAFKLGSFQNVLFSLTWLKSPEHRSLAPFIFHESPSRW